MELRLSFGYTLFIRWMWLLKMNVQQDIGFTLSLKLSNCCFCQIQQLILYRYDNLHHVTQLTQGINGLLS